MLLMLSMYVLLPSFLTFPCPPALPDVVPFPSERARLTSSSLALITSPAPVDRDQGSVIKVCE